MFLEGQGPGPASYPYIDNRIYFSYIRLEIDNVW